MAIPVFLIAFVLVWVASSLWTAVAVMVPVVALIGLVLMARDGPSETLPERTKDRGFEVKAHLRITYEDRNGVLSTREIVAKQYLDHSPGEIYAYCKMRRAHRTFITSGVKSAVDLETGEIIKRLPTFLRASRVINEQPVKMP
jgi:hypothetical protein